MANSFKSDESFLRKLAIGAGGTNATIAQLRRMGFDPIELERGSTGFKIWKRIKIKRVRVPDILCLKTGLRFESRGKTKTEMSMSHSLNNPKRTWDAGLRDEDFVSIVVFKPNDNSPIVFTQVSPVHFVSVGDMRRAFETGQVSITKPKGVEEGSEIRVVWPCAAANERSTVTAMGSGNITLAAVASARRQLIRLSRSSGKIMLAPQVEERDTVEANQIVASVVPVHLMLEHFDLVDEAYFSEKLSSVNLSERYAAAKALRYRGYTTAKLQLEARLKDVDEDIYVQLEAAAALAAYNEPKGWEFMESKLHGAAMTIPLETQLETVIVASEVPSVRSESLLIGVLEDNSRDEELRAGAAWALGQFASQMAARALVDTFGLSSLEIRIEAARALLRIAEPQTTELVELLKKSERSKRDGLSWALARTGGFKPLDVLKGADQDLRRWVSYVVGYGKDNFAEAEIEEICAADPEVYFAASVLWQIVTSWIRDLKEY